jgi:hypothetical protein
MGLLVGAASNTLIVDDDNDPGVLEMPPETPTIVAARGAKYICCHLDGVRNWVGKLADHVDIRTTGGLVVLPPSIHPSGVIYRWQAFGKPTDAPDWLIERLRELAQPKRSNADRALAAAGIIPVRRSWGDGDRYGKAAIYGEADAVAAQREPGRNARLNIAAYNLGRLVGGGEITETEWASEAQPRLIDACHRNGLVADDGLAQCVATIQSGFSAGMQRPRTRRAA